MTHQALSPCIIAIHNYHLDGYGHVNNARYLEFLEAARWHFFRECGLWADLQAVQLVVSHVDITYRHAATHHDVLQIHTDVQSVQSRRIVLRQTAQLSGSLKIAAQAVVTLMPTHQGKAFRLPESLISQLNQYIQ